MDEKREAEILATIESHDWRDIAKPMADRFALFGKLGNELVIKPEGAKIVADVINRLALAADINEELLKAEQRIRQLDGQYRKETAKLVWTLCAYLGAIVALNILIPMIFE